MQKGSENMNRIFKVIWSKTRNCYVVASELAKGTSKSTSTGRMAKRAVLAAVAALLISPLGAGYSYATIDSATINGTQVITGTQKDAKNLASTVMKATNNANDIGNLKTAMQSVENELAQHQMLIDNLDTDKLTLSSDNTLQKETYDSATKTTTTTDVTGLKVDGPVSAKSASISRTLSAGGAVNAGSVNSRGNITAVGTIAGQTVTATGTIKGKDLIGTNSIISQGTIAATGNISSQATVGAKEIVSQTNITAKNKVVGMQGVVDNTLMSGNYVTAGNTVGENIVALDTHVKANADAIAEKANATDVYTKAETDQKVDAANTYTYRKVATEEKARETADTELNERITNVKEYLENQTSENYVSKTDAAVQDAGVVKANKKIGENVTALGKGLYDETAARIGADAAQDKVIQAVNDNLVQSVTTINKNVADGFTALNQADANEAAARKAADTVLDGKITAETSARVAADTKLVEAVNSGLSLSNDNVLQKNTTAINAQGNVTTSKTDANEMILNKGKDNQITLNEKGIKVGTNSSVMDKDGVYTGGDTYSEAKAALKSDGSIKGADGKFTVDGTNGNVSTKGSLTAASGTIGNVSMSADGTMTGVKDLTASGKITADSFTDGTATMSNGSLNGVNQINATGNIVTTGNMKAHDITAEGTIKGETINGTIGTFGSLSTTGNASVGGTLTTNGITNTGNATTDTLIVNHNATVGGNLAVTGDITGKSLNVGTGDIKGGQITGTGLDVGAGNIKTTGATETGTLKTTGKAEIGGDLSVAGNTEMKGNLDVKGDLSVEGEFNAKTLSSKLDENNYTIINGGKTQSMNLKMNAATGETQASASTFDETGSNMWAKDADSIGKSTVTADGIIQKLSDTGDNPQAYAERAMSQSTDNKYSMVDTVKDEKKTNVASQSATESSDVVTDANGNTSTFRQRVDALLQEIKNAAGDTLTKVEQTDTAITSQIGDGSAIKSVMNADGIANTATGGTISNSAANINNTTTGNMTNTVGGNLIDTIMGTSTTTVTGKVTEDYKSDLSTKVGGDETHAVTGNQTTTVSGNRTVNVKGTETENFNALETNVKTDQKTSVGGNQTNIVTGNQQNTVSGSKLETVKGSVTEKYGSQATTIDGEQSTHVGGNQENVVTGNQTNTISGNKTETVKGAVTETYGSQNTKVNGDQSTTVTGDSSLTAENINNTAKNKITNKAIDVETDASSSIVNKVSNDAGSNTSTQLSYQTKEEMSQADGKTASYLRGAAEEKSQLTDGDKKTTIDTVAGQTNTNITDGTNTSNSLQKADQVASFVTDGTNTTVVNQDAKSLASSITDGTKANNTNNTVDKSEQLIKASDTQYSATSKTATKMEDALVSGSSIIDVIKNLDDAANPFISSAVTDGTNSTGVTQTAKDITNTAKNGTIANDAKDITNNAAENMTNTVGKDLSTTVGGNQTTTVTGDSSLTAENITNKATKKLSNAAAEIENSASTSITDKVGDNVRRTMTTKTISESVKDGTKSNSFSKNAEKDINIITDGTNTSTLSQLADSVNTSLKNGTQSLNNKKTVTEDVTKMTDKNTGAFSSSSQKADAMTNTVKNGSKSNTVTETASTSEQKLVSGNILDILKDAENGYVNTTVSNSDGSSSTGVKQTYTDITSTAKQGTITNDAKNLVNKAEEKLSNSAAEIENTATTSIKDTVGKSTVTTTTDGTTFENTDHNTAIGDGSITKTTISGNTLETGKATMDYAEVMKDLTVGGTTTTKDLHVTNNATIDGTLDVTGAANFQDTVTVAKDLSVSGSVTASSYKVGDKTYISESGINANKQKVVNVAAGDLSANSTDAVNGAQLYQTNERVTGVENKVNKLDSRVDKVGANAAALANLHPLEFDADSKWNIAAAVGGYKGETATAIGAFYRPNENVMVNVSSSFGTGENMYGGGISLRIGQGGNKARRNATNGLTEREKAMQKQIDSLTNRLDALLSVINPNMSKDFPDVPENHWAYEAVSRLAGNGVIQGYEDGKYHGDRTMTRYEMAEIIYNALSKGAKAEKKLVEEFKPELQAMAAQKKA